MPVTRTRAAALAVALALAGCAGREFAEEADALLDPPAEWETVAAVTAPAPEVCAGLGDQPLAALIRSLDAGSLELRSAEARLAQAEAVARSRRSPLVPRLDLSINGSRGEVINTGGAFATRTPLSEVYQGSFAASYEVDVWGRLRDEYRGAALDAAAAAETAAALRLSLGAELADAWLALVAQRELVDLLEAQEETSARFLELTRLRFGLGQAPAVDVGRQKQQLLSVRGQQALARGQARSLEAQLGALLGNAEASLPPARRLPAVPPTPQTGVPAHLAEARPDVRAAHFSLIAADRRLEAAFADRLPAFNINASLQSVENTLGELFSENLWQIGAQAATNLFDFGQQRAAIDSAEAVAEQALYDYGQTLLDAWSEVARTLADSESRDAFAASLRAQLTEAEKVLVLTRESYGQGQASFLDVLTALQSKQTLEQNLIDARRTQLANRVQLCRALGVPVAAGGDRGSDPDSGPGSGPGNAGSGGNADNDAGETPGEDRT